MRAASGSFRQFVVPACSSLVVAALLASPSTALAQVNEATAETLFREGVRLLDEGKTNEACTKFAASQKADPALGTLLNLAMCHEKAGRTATAWLEFSQAASQARQLKQRDREQLARTRAKALEKQLHRVSLVVARAAPRLEITIDGQQVVEAAWPSAFPVDPGEHRLEASAPGRRTWQKTFTVAASAGEDRLDVPELVAEVAPAVPAVVEPAQGPPVVEAKPEPAPVAAPPPGGERAAPRSTQRTVGFVVGAAGLVTLGVSGYFWVHTSSLDSDRKAADDRNDRATADSLRSDALSAQTMAAVTSAVGAVALGTGIVLVLTSGRGAEANKGGWMAAPLLGNGAGGMNLRGAW
jgi:hypothetical protein